MSLAPFATYRFGVVTALGLGLLVWLSYAGSLDASFTLDNRWILLADPRVQSLTPEHVKAIFTQDYEFPDVTGLYRPLTTLSYLFNHAVLGNADRPPGYHVINILLHWINAVLVYAIVRSLARRRDLAPWSAALFACHPIATEAVTNIVGRADLLAACSVLAGLLLYVKGSPAGDGRRSLWLLGLASISALGFLCKENAAVLLAVVCLFDFAQRRRVAVLPCLAMGLPILAIGYARHVLYAGLPLPATMRVDNPLVGASFWTARATALQVIARYAWLLIWPARLSCDYSWDQIPLVTGPSAGWPDVLALIGVALVAGTVLVALRQRRARPLLAFFVAFPLVALLPTSNLFVLIGSIMGERFLYLPLVGFSACVAILVFALCTRLPVRHTRAVAAALLGSIVLAASLRSVERNRDWLDDVRLWSSAVAVSPRSFKTHHALAYALYQSDAPRHEHIDQSIAESETALRILANGSLPRSEEPSAVSLNLGIYYEAKGWNEKALWAFERAVEVDQVRNARAWEKLGRAAMRLHRYSRASEALGHLRQLRPGYVAAYLDLARVQQLSGQLGDAAITATQALLLDAHDQGARALLVGIYDEIDAAGCALRTTPRGREPDPDCPRVRSDLCAAYRELAALFESSEPAGSAAQRWRSLDREKCQ